MSVPRFGRVQLQIMQVLWERGKATAREITDVLNEAEPIAHSTVQTLLRKLEDKGAVEHVAEGRNFLSRPLAKPPKVKKTITQDLIDRVFGGSPAGLVAYLLKHERISQAELNEIRRLIDGETQ